MQYRIGIIGGGGYTAGELLRILVHHPAVEIAFVHSQSQSGKPVYTVHENLIGDTDIHFTSIIDLDIDVLFLCSGHEKSAAWLAEHQPAAETLVIDLSSDFRLSTDFIYGLPELNREQLLQTKRVANPGCFATAIQLGLLPLAAAKALSSAVHIHAVTGSTGAGQSPTATTHFSWRNNNLSIYKPFTHQHLAEIGRSLTQLHGEERVGELNFIPLRGDFTRGIFASLYLETTLTEAELKDLYATYYSSHPFTHVAAANPNLKQVVGTNKAIVHVSKHEKRVLIVSLIDNLLKGASGQAVQNMNLALGIAEDTGLQLKGIGF